MSTIWGDKHPGQNFAAGQDELGAYTISGEPDRIRTPPELGSVEYKVSSIYQHACACGKEHDSKTYALEGTDLQVSECIERGFLWWKPRK